jgi:hypothetical protein
MSKHANKEQITVTEAEATLQRFERERNDVLDRRTLLADKRREIAFDALSGDKSASKLLDGLHREAVELESRLVSVNDAIAEAQRRLAAAREHEAREADGEKASALCRVLTEFLQTARALDAALVTVAEHGNRLHELQASMHMLGAAVPSAAQLDALGYRCLLTAIGGTVWRRHFETLAPHERRSFSELCALWGRTLQRSIAARLGDAEQISNEQTKTETEAA